jgi:phospholipid/cholesterol/gamma-HCH transport system permease protein
MAILTAQTTVAAVTPPYTWGQEFLDQCWLVVKRAFIHP